MKKTIKNILSLLVLVLCLSFLFACSNKGPTDLEKVLDCTASDCKTAEVYTIISVNDTTLYSETSKYTAIENGYNKITDIEKLAGLTEKTDGENHKEEVVASVYSLIIKEDYLTNIVTDGVTLSATLTESGVKDLINANASEALIGIKTDNGKILEIQIEYVLEGQTVNLVAKYTY